MTLARLRASAVHLLLPTLCALHCASAMAASTEAADTPRSPRLVALSQALAAGDPDALPAFWREIDKAGTPVMEPLSEGMMLVTFVVRATGASNEPAPSIYGQVGDTQWPIPVTTPTRRLEGSDVWFRTFEMSNRARFSYHVVRPQGARDDPAAVADYTTDAGTQELFVDRLNPKTYVNGWMKRIDPAPWTEDWPVRGSYAEGPQAVPDPFVAERPGARRGTVTTHDVASRLLGNQRKITVYTPPGRDGGCAECDFLLVFDRAAYISAVPTPTILDNMQADGVIAPIVAVFVGNSEHPGRGAELPPNPLFQRFLREELMPWMRTRYRFTRDPRRAVVAGSSFGALAATYTALRNPEVFGNVLSQSGSYWWWPQWQATGLQLTESSGALIREYSEAARLPIRFYMETGTWEGNVMLEPNRRFRDVLLGKGYDVQYEERIGGHDYVRWRDSLSEGLRRLLGNDAATGR